MVGTSFEKARVITRNLRLVVLAPYISFVLRFPCMLMQHIVRPLIRMDLANIAES